ncbi:MAG TPA: DUF885 family protein [Phenylobacterium sp.]|jgi:uncharacterized protein (DUF885 family)|uniref:DUF885 domain-containing protein n=1 Tax=Phenylobacterium sp. TaxID=1871053 RepID=UPI002D2FFC6E|nr:DUF885 family protein [Phenylobacterium sp.]HZZ68549.1 DUF885 family protein [Phenylobacterium sp.]
MLDRRQLLSAGASAAAIAAAPAARAQSPESAKLTALLDGFFQENLERQPETATQLGFDKGKNAGLKFKLEDVSTAGMAAESALNRSQMRRLKTIDRTRLSGMDAVNYDTVLYVAESTQPLLDLDLGGRDGFSPSCYVLSPITGAYQRMPDFLDDNHTIETATDAEAYLARLDGFATALDSNTDRFRHDEGKGVLPPDFLLDITIAQVGALRTTGDKSDLVKSLDRRARAKGLGEAWGHKAAAIYDAKVGPALDRQIAALKAARPGAVHDAGVWRFKEGPAFYAANLKYTTTTGMTPAEVHKLGLDQAKEYGAALDVLLKKQGLTQGTVGERIKALYKDPSYYFPNTDPGRAQLLAYLQDRLTAMKARLPRMFDRLPHQQIEARRVPPAIEAGSPGAYSESAPMDRSRPGVIFFNLADTHEWPKWNLPSTLYHEGLPGHQLQGGLAQESPGIPLLRKNMYFSAYGEGWALYAEQLAQELGMYEDDPLGEIGYRKAQIFRAGRCVVDTGMHAMRWSREQAIQYLMGLDGDAEGSTTREVQRYCAIPAQACSYKIGHTFWLDQRARARKALGPKFDIKAFHDAGLLSGAMPLDVLAQVVGGYIASAKA